MIVLKYYIDLQHLSLMKCYFYNQTLLSVHYFCRKKMEFYYDKNKKRPSIFDIAMAYEDGYDSIKEPKKDGGNKYSDTYNELTEDERYFVFRHPIYAYKFNKNAEKARVVGRRLGGTSNGYGDAVRHCYWCALNQISAGLNSPLAEEFGNAHENKQDNDSSAKAMDLHNNSIGYYLGNQAIINNWSEEELLNNIIKLANDGKLKILE